MNRIGDDVAQIQEIESALVGDHSDIFPDREPCGQYMLARRRWIFDEAVEPPPHANEPAALYVM